jgi:hypothetical protein
MELKQVERELDELERQISQLKRDFEIYFAGASKQPPLDSWKKLEKSVRRYGQNTGYTYAQRFRFSTLSARFNTYQDLWNKQLRMKEEGKQAPGASAANQGTPPKPKSAPIEQKKIQPPFERVFKQYVAAKEKNGESSANLNLDKFAQLLKSQKDNLIKKYHCKDVEFYVAVEDGKTKLKAKPLK